MWTEGNKLKLKLNLNQHASARPVGLSSLLKSRCMWDSCLFNLHRSVKKAITNIKIQMKKKTEKLDFQLKEVTSHVALPCTHGYANQKPLTA